MEIASTLRDFIADTFNIGSSRGTFGDTLANEIANFARIAPSAGELANLQEGDKIRIVARSPKETFEFYVVSNKLTLSTPNSHKTVTDSGHMFVRWADHHSRLFSKLENGYIGIFIVDGFLVTLEMDKIGSIRAKNMESFEITKAGQPMKARRRQRKR